MRPEEPMLRALTLRSSQEEKSFLGPSIQKRTASIGVRAARAAGVIVDENGKMRCPPGTESAQEFTDLQMSNCGNPPPKRGRLARGASEAVDRARKQGKGTRRRARVIMR